MGSETSIIKETPQQKGLSLKWKWALGSAAGVFLIFIIFAWFMIQAFSTQMLKTERQQVSSSLEIVTTRLQNLDESKLLPANVDDMLRPKSNDLDQVVNDPVLQQITRQDYTVRVYNANGAQVYPIGGQGVAFRKVTHQEITLQHDHGPAMLVGRQELRNTADKVIGYVVIENHLTSYHATFNRVYMIIVILIGLGLFLVALWGYWLSDYLLRPVNNIKRVVDEIQSDPQSQARVVNEDRKPDELTDLSDLLNDMLNRMQRFILQQHQFVEDVSHELRTPVAIVKGHMELLNRWGKDDPKILDESITASLQEMRRMEGLVSEMLDLTRADQVELTFRDGDTDVKDMINGIYMNFQMIHPDFTFGLDDDLKGPTIVNMNRDHLEQILIILSDNAVKYSQNRKEIHFAASRSGNMVELAVQDFGEGISPEDAARVFDRFYRVDKARSRKQGGNGLGLSIAQKLVEGYGGHIELESAIGQGSIFRITLPIKQQK
ncbi:sensor histidine kinase [Weissella cibaria]|uniref:HAMP domain-containing sensor histidine kinase n=1 Tax=Weissella cibaria TaxID=137591 RepID=UPI0021C02C06|nr:HAMP domain-containing histidine kinase [Weissella cibaria]MCT8400410.1 sensor histidine kinase [Weissella cibaria]